MNCGQEVAETSLPKELCQNWDLFSEDEGGGGGAQKENG